MAIKHLPPKPKTIINVGWDTAPIIYGDGIIAHAVHEGSGIVQIEIATNVLQAIQDGDQVMLRPKVRVVACLRLSESATNALFEVCGVAMDRFAALRKAAAAGDKPAP